MGASIKVPVNLEGLQADSEQGRAGSTGIFATVAIQLVVFTAIIVALFSFFWCI